LLALFLGTLLSPSIVSAQTANAAITGRITDPSKAVLVDAHVAAINTGTNVRYEGRTNNAGSYVIPELPPGPYRVEVEKAGFRTIIETGVVLHVQDTVEFNYEMALGTISESITVTADTNNVNTTDGSVSTVIDQKFVQNIPLNGRSFQDLISLTPGVVTQSPQTSGQTVGYSGDFSVNGQRTESNYYTVDGVTANISAGDGFGVGRAASSGSLAATTALGTTQSLISVDAMQEFRVLSSTYSAEYGRTPGGQFSLVTRSGTNSFHGTVFDYLRNDAFDANDWFNDYYGQPKPALRQNDFGGTLGGPVWIPGVYDGKNKTFFFASYEGLRLTQPEAASLQFVPDSSLRQSAPPALQGILNAFPLPSLNGIDYGNGIAQFFQSYSLPSRIDSTSVRIDHTVGQKLSLFFRYGYTPSSTASRALSALTQQHINTNTYTFGATSLFSGKTANEFRLGYARSQSSQFGTLDSFGGASPINLATAMGLGAYADPNPYFDLYFYGVGDVALQTPNARSKGRQWNATDIVSVAFGHHQFKFGADYRRIIAPLTPSSPFAYAEFDSSQSVLANSTDYAYVSKSVPATPVFNEFSAFAQDEWRAAPRLTLSLGLRWEIDPPPSEAHGNDAYTLLGSIGDPASLTLAPQGTPLWKTSWYNIAPRLGVAWTARATPGWETVLRSGGGVFFDTDNELATQGFSGVGFNSTNYLSSVALPFVPSQLEFSTAAVPPYTGSTVIAFPAHLQLPYTLEWNVSLQQSLATKQTLTVSYLGANGRRLIQQQELLVNALNPNFDSIYFVAAGVTSNYQALQAQFQRSVPHGIHALAAYTWSHSIDFGSNGIELPVKRGNSDFDVRNNFQAGITWDLPTASGGKTKQMILNHWGVDARVMARSGFPVTLFGNYVVDPATGQNYYSGVNIVPDEPIYLYGSNYPGGRAINPAAFSLPSGNDSGNAPRNFVRGFGATQLNIAVHREFHFNDKIALQFRAETFNLLNHPNFGYVDPYFFDATFGEATQTLNHSLGTVSSLYQQGGARSMQFSLKVIF
jgi:hypothetical protein